MEESGLGEMPAEKEETSFSGANAKGVGDAGDNGERERAVVGERPEFRVVQAEYDTRIGKTLFKDVGAMWKNRSKAGKEFYTMKIGKLKLLVFPNNKE